MKFDGEIFPTTGAPDPLHVRLSGTGGQGTITAGVILAEAALMDGRNVVQTQSFGPEARLGASKSDVIISTRTIAYPEVHRPDILLCLSQDAFHRYRPLIHDRTVVILDSGPIKVPELTENMLAFPIMQTAVQAGGAVTVNVVSLGLMNALMKIVSPQNLRQTVLRRINPQYRSLNEASLDAGEQLAQCTSYTPWRTSNCQVTHAEY